MTSQLVIKNGNVIGRFSLAKKDVYIASGKIKDVCNLKGGFLKSKKCIDAKGLFVAPGFIDLHIHGTAQMIESFHLKFGTTSFLAGFCGSDLEKLKSYTSKSSCCLGVFCEGPFINPDMRGAIPKSSICRVNLKLLQNILKASNYSVKIMTIAPELKDCEKLIRALLSRNVIPALGHTNSSFEGAMKASSMGVTYTTHCFNRMSLITARDPGVLGAIFCKDDIICEVIVDGIHVHPGNFKLLLKYKGRDRIVLVTDNVECSPMPNSIVTKRGFRLKKNNALAGSNVRMNDVIRNVVTLCKVSLVDAVNMASFNPARIIGVDRQKGSIEIGKDADIVIFDKGFNVKFVIKDGIILVKP